MSRLINADKLKEAITTSTPDSEIGLDAVIDIINKAPAVDAVPVVHAKMSETFKWNPIKVHYVTHEDVLNGEYADYDEGRFDIIGENPDGEYRAILLSLHTKYGEKYVEYDEIDSEGYLQDHSWADVDAWAELPKPYGGNE